MLFCEVNFAARWLGLTALIALGLPAWAQQDIQFSKPVDKDPGSKANAFMPESSRQNPASFNAPLPLFGGKPGASFDVLPGGPPRVFYNANPQLWQKFLDDKKNWTLMTPEQVLGIPTPEKILGVADPNDDPNLSVEERFLKRQDMNAAMAATNGMHRADGLLWQKQDSTATIFQSPDQASPFGKTVTGPVPGVNPNLGSVFSPHTDQSATDEQRFNSAWVSPFNSPEPMPKPTPEQLAETQRFHELMDPPSAVSSPQSPGFFGAPAAAVDPNMQAVPASFNPVGHSFTGLQDDIGRPTGLTPLAGVTGPIEQPKKAAPSVQPPPWMQNPLQNSTMPQRQF